MAWTYHFVDLTEEDIFKRRILLDRYGLYAQLSALIPILAFQLYRLGVWVFSRRQRAKPSYTAVSSSPVQKQERESTNGGLKKWWRSTLWWLEGEVYPEWGLRGHWIVGMAWAFWLLFLVVHKTGEGKSLHVLFYHRQFARKRRVTVWNEGIRGLRGLIKPTATTTLV